MSQIDQAQKLLKKLLEEIDTAQGRLAIAQNTATDLETRNQSVLANIEREGGIKQRFLVEQAQKRQAEVDVEIAKAEKVKSRLIDDVNSLNTEKESVERSIDESVEAKNNLDIQIADDSEKHQDNLEQILKSTNIIRENEVKINDQRNMIRELATQKGQVEADIEVLRNEQDNIEGTIIELDAQYKSQKDYHENDLYATKLKLKNTLDSLIQAQNQDKAFRKGWADETMKLEKRTQAVRRMEARVSDAEARIEELKKYDVL